MKKNVLFALVIINLAGIHVSLQAQITITSADATAINAVGNVITNHVDTTTLSVNIGSPGATSWDYSGLNSHSSNKFTSVTPSSTPYISDFSASNVVFSFDDVVEGDTANAWQYSTQNAGEYLMDGLVMNSIIDSDTFLMKYIYSPAEVIFPLPFTYNNQWSSTYEVTSSTFYNGIPFFTFTSNNTVNVVVDAWGALTMPGGTVVQALRLRTDHIVSNPEYTRTISYSFLTKHGSAVEITASDTSAPNSGIIATQGIAWSSNTLQVGLDENLPLSPKYALYQNKPNPVNDHTLITYTTGERQIVSLKVFAHTGTEIATLVNEPKTAGSYEVNFDASDLKPGIYYYKLRAGEFSETRKMVVIR